MAKKSKGEANVPNLRFPGFQEAWTEKKLGDLLEFKNGINASKEQYGKGIKFINVLDILSNDFITYEKITGSVDVTNTVVEKYPVKYGDILFQRSSETREEVGTANVYLDKDSIATFGGFVIRGRKIGEYDPIFFNKLLKTKAARESITSKSGGSTRYNVGQEILSSIALHFPTLSEQKKIAAFLSAIDARIVTQNKIIRNLETFLEGFRKQIYNQKIRFKDKNKNAFPDWKVNRLADILIKNTAKNRGQQCSNLQSVSNRFGFIKQDDFFEDRRIASTDTSNYYLIRKGYFAYNPSRINVGSLAYKFDDTPAIVSPLYISFKVDNDKVVDMFLLEWFSTNLFAQQMNSSFEGSVRNTLSYDSLVKMYISIPCIEEQLVISNVFSRINKKIKIEEDTLKQYKVQKKQLLQSMFI